MSVSRDVASISIPQSQSPHETTTGFTDDRLHENKESPPKQSYSNPKSQPLIETINSFTKDMPDEIKKQLLDQSYETHHKEPFSGGINGSDKEGKTPLIHAVQNSDFFTIKWLCRDQDERSFFHQDPDFNHTDIYGMTALIYAGILNNEEILIELTHYSYDLFSYAEQHSPSQFNTADKGNLEDEGDEFIHGMEDLINEEEIDKFTQFSDKGNLEDEGDEFIHGMENLIKEEEIDKFTQSSEQEENPTDSDIENLKDSESETSDDESLKNGSYQRKEVQAITYPARFFSTPENQSLDGSFKSTSCSVRP